MNNELKRAAFCMMISAGTTATLAQASNPTTLTPSHRPVVNAGHIYFNAVTGERVLTVLGDSQTAPADTGNSSPLWAAEIQNACAGVGGYVTSYFFGVDDATGTTSLSTNITLLDYGDIAQDSVVDCIQINWVVSHPDQWANGTDSSSGVAGVEELAGQWMVWDADNGRAINQSTRLPIMDFLFFNLPGNTPDNQSAGALTGWTADVDLVGFGSATDLSFELGDTDGDCQAAAFCNEFVGTFDNDFDGLPDSDLDGDGLFDWSWTVRFYQPQMGNDFDSDGDTGVLAGSASDTIGVSFGYPEGTPVDNGDGTWTWDINEAADAPGTGAEDRFAIYNPPNSTGAISYNGGYWFGGFACTGGLISTGGNGYTPPGMFQVVLYGPNGGIFEYCDYNGDGVANFFDVSAYIADFNAMEPLADVNNDGLWNFFDVSLFIQAFNAGCP